MENCTKFGQLILRKIIIIVATSDFKAKCTKFDFGWGSAPEPAEGAYSTPQPPAGLMGPTSKGREGEKRGGTRNGGKRGERRVSWICL